MIRAQMAMPLGSVGLLPETPEIGNSQSALPPLLASLQTKPAHSTLNHHFFDAFTVQISALMVNERLATLRQAHLAHVETQPQFG